MGKLGKSGELGELGELGKSGARCSHYVMFPGPREQAKPPRASEAPKLPKPPKPDCLSRPICGVLVPVTTSATHKH